MVMPKWVTISSSIAAVMLGVLVGPGPAQAQQPTIQKVGILDGWDRYVMVVPQNNLEICFSERPSSYPSVSVSLVRATTNTFHIYLSGDTWAMQTGQPYPVGMSIDQGDSLPVTGTVLTPTLISMDTPQTNDFFQRLADGHVLHLATAGKLFSVNLEGAKSNLQWLVQCAQKRASGAQ